MKICFRKIWKFVRLFVRKNCERRKDQSLERHCPWKRDTFVLARMIAIEGILVVETLPALHICREESENMCVRTWDSGGGVRGGERIITSTMRDTLRTGMQLRTHHMHVTRKCRFSQSGFSSRHRFSKTRFQTSMRHAYSTVAYTASKIGVDATRWISEIPFGFRRNTRHQLLLSVLRPTSDVDRMKLTKYDYDRRERSETVTSMGIFHRQDSITAAKIINFREIFPSSPLLLAAVLSSEEINSICQILLF